MTGAAGATGRGHSHLHTAPAGAAVVHICFVKWEVHALASQKKVLK